MTATAIPTPLLATMESVRRQGGKFDAEDSPSNKYFGLLVEIERVQYREGGPVLHSVMFELVPFEWMQAAILSLGKSLRGLPPASPYTQLAFDEAPLGEVAAALGTDADGLVEGEWYIITLGRSTGIRASRASPRGSTRIRKTRASGIKAPRRLQRSLQRSFRPITRFDTAALTVKLQAMQPAEVGVMDVGQASCNLVYDAQGHGLLYVDVGLPIFFQLASSPPGDAIRNPGPCLGNNPTGIITHYHWDHYYMLVQAANRAALRDRDWIFPPQGLTPAIVNVIHQINATHNGRVHIFPAALGQFTVGHVEVVRCVPGAGVGPNDRNNTGLAVAVRLDTANQRYMLMPGDAAYQSIPGLAGAAGLRWMAATHHGSATNLAPPPAGFAAPPIPAPYAANEGRLAYSYGINGPVPGGVHCFGHPNALAVAAYPVAGWGNANHVAATAETGPNSGVAGRGNIMMAGAVIPPACGVANCPFHVFPKILV